MNKCGGILLNKELNKIALVVRKENEYSFPKGHIESGEELLKCAIRETVEETGCDVELLTNEPIGIMKYNHKVEGEVFNYMYLFVEKGKTSNKIEEVDMENTVWIDIRKVYDILSYQNLKDFWEEVLPKINEIINEIK